MRWNSEVMKLLRQGREDEVAALIANDRRALRPLLGRLWDPDGEIRHRAARAVGRAAGAHRDLGLEVIRRMMWALNDESATNGLHAIPALGEIGRVSPELIAPFVPALVAMTEDAGIRVELLRALTAIAESAPWLFAGHLSRLSASVDETNPEEQQALELLRIVVEGTKHEP